MGFIINNGILEKYTEDDGITDITIPNGVIDISDEAFIRCIHIKNIVIPDGVRKIGRKAFYKCIGLEKISLPDSLEKIGEEAFYECSGLRAITIPDSITQIEERTFYRCGKLINIKLSKNLITIKPYAFYWCDSIEEIEIPESVKSIEYWAFVRCQSLERIIVSNIMAEESNFGWCIYLKNITIKGKKLSISINNVTNLIKDKEISGFIKTNSKYREWLFGHTKNPVYKILFGFFLAIENENQKCIDYIKKNIVDVAEYFTDNNEVENLTILLQYIDKEHIDYIIKYAIDAKKPEIQVILMNYKNRNFGFDDDNFDDFVLR